MAALSSGSRNTKPVWGRGAEDVTGEARRLLWMAGRGGFWEGWIVGACEAIQSSRCVFWRKAQVFGVWSEVESWPGGRSATEEGEVLRWLGEHESHSLLDQFGYFSSTLPQFFMNLFLNPRKPARTTRRRKTRPTRTPRRASTFRHRQACLQKGSSGFIMGEG